MQVFLFILGLIVGSFLNVCIYRLPRGESIVRPGSHCPNCKRAINCWDNIPLLSYLLLNGRCRYCRWKIPLRYPLVELLTALVLVVYYNLWGLSLVGLIFVIFTLGLMIATFSDFETQVIPDQVSLGLLPFGIFLSFYNPIYQEIYFRIPILESVLGALVGGGMIYLSGLLGKWAFKKPAMGLGDVKFMALIGTFLGWKLVVLVYFIAPFLAIFFGLYQKIRYQRDYLPYGPFLAMAALLVFFFRKGLLEFVFYLK